MRTFARTERSVKRKASLRVVGIRAAFSDVRTPSCSTCSAGPAAGSDMP